MTHEFPSAEAGSSAGAAFVGICQKCGRECCNCRGCVERKVYLENHKLVQGLNICAKCAYSSDETPENRVKSRKVETKK